MGKVLVGKHTVCWLLPLVVVVLSILLLHSIFSGRAVSVQELVPVDGVLDIRETDLSAGVYNIRNNWDFYPAALYTSEDFASGAAGEKAADDVSTSDFSYGTHRLRILAQPNQYYTLCSFSLDYASRVFVNGSEVAVFGQVAEDAVDFVPRVGYMTIPLYSGETGEMEIIYHYGNFVHDSGGYIQPTYLSTPQNMEEFKSSNDLVSLSVSGGLLLLTFYFLLSAALRRKVVFLYLALLCMLVALRDQNFFVIHLLPTDYSWFIAYRILILDIMLLPASILLLLKGIYVRATKNWPLYLYLGVAAVATVLLAFLPTRDLVTVSTTFYYVSIPYLLYLVYGVVRYYIRQGKLDVTDVLVLFGYAVLLGTLVYEALLTRQSAAVTRYGATGYGTLCFILLNAAAIHFQLQQREVALVESRSRNEMLERMNRLNMEFLNKVAHELKTPLTVISGYAQLTGMQLAGNSVNDETPANLKTIQQEAKRLADLVTKLMEYSYSRKQEVTLDRISVSQLLQNVQAVAAPMCMKNCNQVQIIHTPCADIHGNFEMLLQIFINLIVNASKHTHDGSIVISASDSEEERFVRFRVEDTGSGISPQVMPHIFEQGYSTGGSSGLGLSICQEAVEAHGGRIWVERTDETGTVFAFTVLKEDLP
ncbi:HAMP domain-containing sensor histidine kinase [Pseudoflavonifractor sp. An85]|uniref:sensor histidine kinase n=1 Tax=Pseudoflavonifractor sp. An85 TaxID=1965661 RepID=UPI000B36A49C|nr:HAMP domain-containing sensor histidine kinase [Pseudoflavonifractor sp. An85]OUN21437.1 hypothetical protein B5G37_11090 [Pseudoflavonifractor sp. An85]